MLPALARTAFAVVGVDCIACEDHCFGADRVGDPDERPRVAGV